MVKYLPCKDEDLSSESQDPHEKLPVTLALGVEDIRGRETGRP